MPCQSPRPVSLKWRSDGARAEKRGDFLIGGQPDFDGVENHLRVQRDDFFEFKEMGLVLRPEFFGAGGNGEVIELFPALDVGLNPGDQLVGRYGAHACSFQAGDGAAVF